MLGSEDGRRAATVAFLEGASATLAPPSAPEDRAMLSAITGTPGLTGSSPEDRAMLSAITGTPGLTGSSPEDRAMLSAITGTPGLTGNASAASRPAPSLASRQL